MRGLIGELVSAHHQVTIVDMEAGLEHFSRSGGTLRHVDQLLVVTDMDHKALETARRTVLLAKELGIARVGLVGNKLRDDDDARDLAQWCAQNNVELLAAIPYDESARQADRRGIALYDFDANAITVRVLREVALRLRGELAMAATNGDTTAELQPSGDVAQLSPEEKKRCFPDCN